MRKPLLVMAGALVLLQAPAGTRVPLLLGETWSECLLTIGLLMVLSSSSVEAFEKTGDSYAIVKRQMRAPRAALAVHGAAVSRDGRTLVLTTAPQSQAARYARTAWSGRGVGAPNTASTASPMNFSRCPP